jgi:hypothetical protein
LNSQTFAAPLDHSRGIKQLFFRSAAPDSAEWYAPHFYFETRIDYADVRSGYHMTSGLNEVLDIRPYDADLIWTRDMVRSVDPKAIHISCPQGAKLSKLPEYVTDDFFRRIESQYLSFLLRHAEVRVFRNFALSTYSYPGETCGDFRMRCLDLLSEPFRGELDLLRDVVNRRLERIEQKSVDRDRAGEFESDRKMSQDRNRLHAAAEGIAELFLQTELTMDTIAASGAPSLDVSHPDLEHSLEALEIDVHRDIRRLLNVYQEKVQNIDEYILHPGLKDLHLVRKSILWMPAGVPEP